MLEISAWFFGDKFMLKNYQDNGNLIEELILVHNTFIYNSFVVFLH